MLITTTHNLEGMKIVKYCGVVAGEAILGANLFKDLFAGIRDLVGGRSATYERELQLRKRHRARRTPGACRKLGSQCRGRSRSGLRGLRAGQWDVDGLGEWHGGGRRIERTDDHG